MIDKIFNTSNIPIIGGSAGAVIGDIAVLPTHDQILATIIFAFIGGVVGYGVKMCLDYIREKIKARKHK